MCDLHQKMAIVDLPGKDDFIFLGIDVDQLHQDFKAYRDNYVAHVFLKKVPKYYSVYRDVLYRYQYRDSDTSLSIVVFIAPDLYPVVMLQPVIYDSPVPPKLDQCLLVSQHLKIVAPRLHNDEFFKQSRYEQFAKYVDVLNTIPVEGLS